jgi:endonuclease III
VHIRRVFGRLGLCPTDATPEQVVYKAKALYPEFPGLMDLPCWEIGKKWCKAGGQQCAACYMNDLCPSSTIEKTKAAIIRETDSNGKCPSVQ